MFKSCPGTIPSGTEPRTIPPHSRHLHDWVWYSTTSICFATKQATCCVWWLITSLNSLLPHDWPISGWLISHWSIRPNPFGFFLDALVVHLGSFSVLLPLGLSLVQISELDQEMVVVTMFDQQFSLWKIASQTAEIRLLWEMKSHQGKVVGSTRVVQLENWNQERCVTFIAWLHQCSVTVPGVEHPMGFSPLKCSNLEDCGIYHAKKSLQWPIFVTPWDSYSARQS